MVEDSVQVFENACFRAAAGGVACPSEHCCTADALAPATHTGCTQQQQRREHSVGGAAAHWTKAMVLQHMSAAQQPPLQPLYMYVLSQTATGKTFTWPPLVTTERYQRHFTLKRLSV